jgi:hypothetical protein
VRVVRYVCFLQLVESRAVDKRRSGIVGVGNGNREDEADGSIEC